MKIFETLDRDPRTSALANSGQARITTSGDAHTDQELRAELETFVCDGQYEHAIKLILSRFLAGLSHSRQDAAWISGFYGSGKSHLLKMLGHLWVNTEFEDGSTARSLVQNLSDQIEDDLRELDTQARRTGLPAFAAAGTLPAGSAEFVKLTVLGVIFRARGLPEQYQQARFCFWLRDRGFYDEVRGAVEAAGKAWENELNSLTASPIIAGKLLELDSDFAKDTRDARQVLRELFPQGVADISTTEFLAATRQALAVDGKIPLTILVLDEVQQYIGDSHDRAVMITELAEAIQTQLDGNVMLVASGQSALTGTPNLMKLRDRFVMTVQLSDTDVETVIRKVLLGKKVSALPEISQVLEQHTGEISKHLIGSSISPRSEDREIITTDYPLLPTRRRFWEECFRAVDTAGTQSQLRSQLRILHEALRVVSEQDLGYVIPADALYEAICTHLVSTGVLLPELQARIQELDDGSENGILKRRLCGLIFLINKLPREAGVNKGVVSSAQMLGDLLVEDLRVDSGPLRAKVAELLQDLASKGTLMTVDDEYRLQTTEGAEWDRAYRERAGAIRSREIEIDSYRDQLLTSAVQKATSAVRIKHGKSKLPRQINLHIGASDPPESPDRIVAWLRDGWSTSQKEVENESRRRGQEDPMLHLFLPKSSAEDLRTRIVEALAAKAVLDSKGTPTEEGGRLAQKSMQSRLQSAETAIDSLVEQVLTGSLLLKGGGTPVYGTKLLDKLETGVIASLACLFPRFDEGDHASWAQALRQSRDGSDTPFKVVGWDGRSEDHPVCKEVLRAIGSGQTGAKIRSKLESSPFGWPRDAIDSSLIELLRLGIIRAASNNQSIAAGQLTQAGISKAEFHAETVRLGVTDFIALRGLFSEAGVPCKKGEEQAKAGTFLERVEAIAKAAGGPAPLPPRPQTTFVGDLRHKAGTEQLAGILAVKDDFDSLLTDCKQLEPKIEKRLPRWSLLKELLSHARTLPVADEVQPERDAIESNRSLLAAEDPTTPLLAKLTSALRSELSTLAESHQAGYLAAIAQLATDATWLRIKPDRQQAILDEVGLVAPFKPTMKSDTDLNAELQRASLSARADAIAAIQGRVRRALELALEVGGGKTQKPTIKVSITPTTLETEDQAKQFLSQLEGRIKEGLEKGAVIVG